MKYDVFLSYRRRGGSERAELLKAILVQHGYAEERIFMDTHSLRGGDFKARLTEAIENSNNVVVLITKGCFDDIKENDYWIYEIAKALELKKNIIPVYFDGITAIDGINLPRALKDLPGHNAVGYNHEYADAFYRKFISFLIKEKGTKRRWPIVHLSKIWTFIKNNTKAYAVVFCICIFVLLVLLFMYYRGQHPERMPTVVAFSSEGDTIAMSVDLGLPSQTRWCDRNIGASIFSDNGYLFSWGEVTPIESNKKKNINSSSDIRGTSYDVASITLGKEWVLPTSIQFEELIAECQWEWTTCNGTSGYMLTGPNGNTLFLPAAGCVFKEGYKYYNQFGYYWTSESDSKTNNLARELIIGLNDVNMNYGQKYVGRSIRPVVCGK